MSYQYEEFKPWLFSDEGQRALIAYRDSAFRLIDVAGAVRFDKIVEGSRVHVADSWRQIAIVDRLVEIQSLVCAWDGSGTQYRIYMKGNGA